jgi:hypothetical protein
MILRRAERIESAIEESVPKDEATRTTEEILRSFPGGQLTANLRAVDLPGLGRPGAE